MIITIDGYDGTGKTTLAKNLADKYGFTYIEKPVITMTQHKLNCSHEAAARIVQSAEAELFSNASKREITKFYCDAFVWLKQFSRQHNIVLDRGLLTTYAVVGDAETEDLFDSYLQNGAFFDMSIYLTAKDEERVRRIHENDPTDSDLKHPVKWRDNNLEEYATSRKLNYHKINTDDVTPEQVFLEATRVIDRELERHQERSM